MAHKKLTAERLRDLLDYDPDSGEFRWKNKRGPNHAGSVAGCISSVLGYKIICVDYAKYYGHRLAWLYVHGVWPEHQIDHENGVRHDNRIANLRSCTLAENRQNLEINGKNTSGVPGVSPYKRRLGVWRASISVNNKTKHLGLFATVEEAGAAYANAKRMFHAFQPTVREAA